MPTLEIFYDYACPFCLRAHEKLPDLLRKRPELTLRWLPVEAHPRPETYGRHSDLLCQAFFFARDHGAELWPLHEALYRAALVDAVDIEQIDAVCAAMQGLLDTEALRASLAAGEYARENADTNDYAYQRSGVWAVPSFRLDGRKLDAVENVGVTREQIALLLEVPA